MATNFDLYHAACAADNAYHDALVARYGAKAADKRYLLDHSHAELRALAAAKIAADAAWLEEMRRTAH